MGASERQGMHANGSEHFYNAQKKIVESVFDIGFYWSPCDLLGVIFDITISIYLADCLIPHLFTLLFFFFCLSPSLFISLSIPLPAPRSHQLPRSMGMPGRAFTISRSPLSGREMWSFLAVIIIVISPPSRSATRS